MLKELKGIDYYLVRIEYKEPKGVIYKNIKATKYPDFIKKYSENALSRGLIISEFKVKQTCYIFNI